MRILRKAISINPRKFISDFSYLMVSRRFSLIVPNSRSLKDRFCTLNPLSQFSLGDTFPMVIFETPSP
jgi:hypothetical protein